MRGVLRIAMKRYKIAISYDGTEYYGWQIQPRERTVQEEIEKAISRITGQQTRVHGSGRTDQGVHAREQIAHFDLSEAAPPKSLVASLNAVLPTDIRLLRLQKVPGDFDARRHAVNKEYRYFIWNHAVVPPFLRLYRAHVVGKLDLKAMRDAAAQLVGSHDFASFTANPNREIESTVRNLTELNIRPRGNEVVVIARGDGFLYKMVRSICGFLIRVGEGAIDPCQAKEILESRVRTALVPTAPAHGLFLWRVTY